MDSDAERSILQEIRELFHGLGERSPRIDTVIEIKKIVLKQISLLIFQSDIIAKQHQSNKIQIKHVIYVLQNYKFTLIRILTYFAFKDTIKRLALKNQISVENSEVMKPNLDKDLVDTILNIEDRSYKIDPMEFLTSFDFKSKKSVAFKWKKKSIFNEVLSAIVDLKQDFSITKEELHKSKIEREIRVNELSLKLSNLGYESFMLCRRRNFQNKLGDWLLFNVHENLPLKIVYSCEVKELILFLAKETVACLFDRVCENRKHDFHVKPVLTEIRLGFKRRKKSYLSTHEDEMKVIAETTFGDIGVAFEEFSNCFVNKLIFD